VAYVVNQPTLPLPWPELDEFVRSVGPFLACAWCALERSRIISAPVATGGLASDALDTLAALQVLRRIPIEDSQLAARSLYDPLAWVYQPRWSRPGANLEALLTSTLMGWASESSSGVKRSLGASLSGGEARAYLANLLRKHRLNPALGDDLRSIQLAEWEALSLGRKRYVLWASMRSAASACLQSDMNEQLVRRVLDREIGRRCAWLTDRAKSGSISQTEFCFLPGEGWRQPLILDIAMETFLPLGKLYWLEPIGQWRL